MAHIAVPAVELGLDHVSIEVPDFADAVGRLDEQLGLHVTVSPQAPERHGRVYLDRAYLEVAANLGRRSWAVTSFFVRFSDPVGLRARLGGARLGYRCQVFEGGQRTSTRACSTLRRGLLSPGQDHSDGEWCFTSAPPRSCSSRAVSGEPSCSAPRRLRGPGPSCPQCFCRPTTKASPGWTGRQPWALRSGSPRSMDRFPIRRSSGVRGDLPFPAFGGAGRIDRRSLGTSAPPSLPLGVHEQKRP